MGAKTGIEWTDATWNPIRGCSRVSEGCRHCYAERQAAHPRLGGPGKPYEGLAVMQNGQPHWTGKIEFVEKHLLDPLKWGTVKTHREGCPGLVSVSMVSKKGFSAQTRKCDCPTRPRRIFVNSMSDLFHENVTDEMRDKIFAVMALCPQHTFQVLTKRPARMLEYFANDMHGMRWLDAWDKLPNLPKSARASVTEVIDGKLPNVWLGVSVENQKAADERIPLLLQTPAAVRFISAERLLGPVDLRNLNLFEHVAAENRPRSEGWKNDPNFPKHMPFDSLTGYNLGGDDLSTLDWVICGGESGPGARPMHPDWARGLRDQCEAAGVSFFFKQWGEYLPAMTDGGLDRSGAQVLNASDEPRRVGKHAAGALLDGAEWKQFPEVRV